MQLSSVVVRKEVKAGLEDDWSELTKNADVNPWMMVKLKELLPGKAGRRPAKEHRAADYAEEDWLLVADHRASWRTRRGHPVVRVPSLPPKTA